MDKTKKSERPPLAINIARIRKSKPWTQPDLAHKVGVHVNTIKDVERGLTNPQPETRKAIADALGVSEDELFRDPAVAPPRDDLATLREDIKTQLDARSDSEKATADLLHELRESAARLEGQIASIKRTMPDAASVAQDASERNLLLIFRRAVKLGVGKAALGAVDKVVTVKEKQAKSKRKSV